MNKALVRESLVVNITYLLTQLEDEINELESQNEIDEDSEESSFNESVEDKLEELENRFNHLDSDSDNIIEIIEKINSLLVIYSDMVQED